MKKRFNRKLKLLVMFFLVVMVFALVGFSLFSKIYSGDEERLFFNGIEKGVLTGRQISGNDIVIMAGENYYVDFVFGDDGNLGTESSPWRTWTKLQTVIEAGDVAYLTGDFGKIIRESTDPVGNESLWITYRAWPGKSAPKFTYIEFNGTERNAYIRFDGIVVDPGYIMTPVGSYHGVVNLRGNNHLTIENSYLEGEKVLGIDGDFAPYAFAEPYRSSTISAGISAAFSSFITIKNCSFKYSYRQITMIQHPTDGRKVENWTIIDSDFSECGEDCVTTSVSGYHYIANNYFHDFNQYHAAFCWPVASIGSINGDWSVRRGQRVTQKNTNASAVFYEIKSGTPCGSFIGDTILLYADDRSNIPSRTSFDDWVLDSDSNVYINLQSSYRWNGTVVGDWSNKQWLNVTQETTGAKAGFYILAGTNFWVTPYSERFPAAGYITPSLNSYRWVLDSDPNIYFMPTAGLAGTIVNPTGDNAHGDFIAAQSSSHDIVIEKNIFNQTALGAQVMKIEPPATNVTFRNNLIYFYYTNAYQLLIGGFETKIYHNTIDYLGGGSPGTALRIALSGPGPTDSDVYLYNNILSGAVYSTGTVHSDYNLWGTAPPISFSEGENSLIISDMNSLYVNRAGRDYRLNENSSAVDFGTDLGIYDDLLGNLRDSSPDAGAYEYADSVFCEVGDINCDGKISTEELVGYIRGFSGGFWDRIVRVIKNWLG